MTAAAGGGQQKGRTSGYEGLAARAVAHGNGKGRFRAVSAIAMCTTGVYKVDGMREKCAQLFQGAQPPPPPAWRRRWRSSVTLLLQSPEQHL